MFIAPKKPTHRICKSNPNIYGHVVTIIKPDCTIQNVDMPKIGKMKNLEVDSTYSCAQNSTYG